jgi:hypothetical protein
MFLSVCLSPHTYESKLSRSLFLSASPSLSVYQGILEDLFIFEKLAPQQETDGVDQDRLDAGRQDTIGQSPDEFASKCIRIW